MIRKCLACREHFECEGRHNFVCEKCKENCSATHGNYIAEHGFLTRQQANGFGMKE